MMPSKTSSPRRCAWAAAGIVTCITGSVLASAFEGPLLLPAADAPEVVAAVGPSDAALALAVSPDGTAAAAAFVHPDNARTSIVRIASNADPRPREVGIRGTVRSLLFALDGATVFAVVHRAGAKRVKDSYLARIGVDQLEEKRIVTLPRSAGALALWVQGSSLLIACEDELRTVLLPEGRSGPLFWVPGPNGSVASLPGADRVLVGRDGAILLVDLSDRRGREPMPIRDRLAVRGAVAELVASPDGMRALARMTDGRVFTIEFDPLRVREEGSAAAIAWIGLPLRITEPERRVIAEAPDASRPVPPLPQTPSTQEPRAPVVEQPVPSPADEPAPHETTPPVATEPDVGEPRPPLSDDDERSGTEAVSPVSEAAQEKPVAPDADRATEPADTAEEPIDPTAERERPAADSSRGEIEGAVRGPAASAVSDVVVLGPDNILREAARVTPAADGTWSVSDLRPGTYRILLDAGGERVVITEPPFLTVKVRLGMRTRAPEIRALRVL